MPAIRPEQSVRRRLKVELRDVGVLANKAHRCISVMKLQPVITNPTVSYLCVPLETCAAIS